MNSFLRFTGLIIFVISWQLSGNCASGQFTPGHFFLDDFEDGDLRDADPVRWDRGRWSAQDHMVVDGDLHIIQSREASLLAPVTADGFTYLAYDDHSLRTQVRLLTAGAEDTTVGLLARVTSSASSVYGAGINSEGVIDVWHFENGQLASKQELQTGLDPMATDVFLQMDLLGDQIGLTAWGEGMVKPAESQISITGTNVEAGTFELRVHGQGAPADAVFRWVEVASIPEPSGLVLAATGVLVLSLRRRDRRNASVSVGGARITQSECKVRPGYSRSSLWVAIALSLSCLPWENAVAQPQRPGDLGDYNVGHIKTTPDDDPTLRNNLYLWYPVDPLDAIGASPMRYTLGGHEFPSDNTALKDVPVSTGGPFPVVVYFHGNGAWGAQQPSLAETLASYGFVVAAMTNSPSSQSMLNLLDDLSARPEHPLFGSTNTDKAGVVGLSAGAGAALSGDISDDRVKAVMPIAGSGTSPRSTAHMLVLTGTLDSSDKSRRSFAQRRGGDRYFTSIERAGHVSYADWCNRIEYADEHYGPDSIPGFRAWAPQACTDAHIDNAEAVDLTNFYATALFGNYLLGDDSYGELLTADYASEHALPVEFEAVSADDRVGDANRDGQFNFADLAQVVEYGHYETSHLATWRSGDWSADARFDTDDLLLAFAEGWYEAGVNPAANVPEPVSSILAFFAITTVLVCRRRR